MDVKHCSGCEQDFYNGNNPYGVEKCWSRDEATFGSFRLIPIDLCPPYLHIALRTLPNCYQAKRHVKVKVDALTKEGYWK